MFILSEQQAFELQRRCEALREESDPLIYAEIESIVQSAVSAKQLPDKDINRLYELLSGTIMRDDKKEDAESEGLNDWDDIPEQKAHNELSEKREKDKIHHLLLHHKASLRTVDAFRRCLWSLERQEKNRTLFLEH